MHAYGRPETFTDVTRPRALLDRLTAQFEAAAAQPVPLSERTGDDVHAIASAMRSL